jgi:hypothetical protein
MPHYLKYYFTIIVVLSVSMCIGAKACLIWCHGGGYRALPRHFRAVRHPALALSDQVKPPGCLGRGQSTGQGARYRGRAVLGAVLGTESKEGRKK